MSFAENLGKLMKDHGTTNYRLSKEIGCSATTVANWLAGKDVTPTFLQKIAEYYNVSTDFLLNTEQKETPILTAKDKRDIEKKLADVLADLENSQDGLMFSGEPLDDTTKELLAASLRNSMQIGKALAKKKYTPKKYRKED